MLTWIQIPSILTCSIAYRKVMNQFKSNTHEGSSLMLNTNLSVSYQLGFKTNPKSHIASVL